MIFMKENNSPYMCVEEVAIVEVLSRASLLFITELLIKFKYGPCNNQK